MRDGAATTTESVDGADSNGALKRPGSSIQAGGKRPRPLDSEISAATQGHEPSQWGVDLMPWGQSTRQAETADPFDCQIVLELGEVPGIADAIQTLVLQHPDKSLLWFRLNEQGYAPVLGDPTVMSGHARILVLGVAAEAGTLGGYTTSALEQKISEFRGWLRSRYHYGGYGLRGSIYEDYLSNASSWNSKHWAYPVSGMGGDGKRDPDFWRQVKKVLRDSAGTREQKMQALRKLDLRLDLHGLNFFRMPGSIATELEWLDGALIADILQRKSGGGHESAVSRVIEPMAGSGVYSNWVRALGFRGKVIVNDINPLVSLTQSEVVSHPQVLLRAIQEIKSDLLAIGRQHGFDFDDNLAMSFERAFPENLALPDKKQERIKRKEKFKAFVKTDRAKRLRQAINEYFEDSLAQLITLKDGRMIVDEPPERPLMTENHRTTARTRVAALFYIMQNSANHNGTVTLISAPGKGHRLHLPLNLLTADEHYKVHLLLLSTNERKLLFLSRLHHGHPETTEFLSGDGWALFARSDVGPGDLILLSGHFSDSYLSVEAFYEKVDQYVQRAAEKGAQILIVNDFSEVKEQGFKQRGFQVSRHARANGNKKFYLLALKNIVVSPGTPEALTDNLRDFVVTMRGIEKQVGFIPGKTPALWNDNDYYDPEAVKRANVSAWSPGEGREHLSQETGALSRDEVGEWDLPVPTASNDSESTSRFDYQLILQLEDNPTVRQAAIDLAGKHPANSLVVQMDVTAKLQWGNAQDALLTRIGQWNRQGKSHWRLQAVGHGRDNSAGQRTLAGYLPAELALAIRQLLNHGLLDGQARARSPAPEHISLVGCALVDNEPTQTASYIQAFAHALDRENIPTRSIAAHSARIIVNPRGGKRGVTVTDTKRVLRRQGESWVALVAPGKTGFDESLLLTETLGEKMAQLRVKNQRLVMLTRADDFQQGMKQLYRDQHLSAAEWLPLWHSLTPEGGDYRLAFVDAAHPGQPPRILRFADRRVADFLEHYNQQLLTLRQAHGVEGEYLTQRPGVTEGEALDGLNALFIVQSLFAWFSQKSRAQAADGELPEILNRTLQVHGWLNTVQMVHGALEDAGKVAQLYRSAMAISAGKVLFSEGKSLTLLSSISKLRTGAGLLLNLGSAVLDIIELSQAQNEAQRAVFATQLAFDSIGLTTSVFSLGASMAANAGVVGAATAAGFAGALAVPLAGLGVGFNALAHAFSAVAEEAAQVGSYFAGLDEAYRLGGYRRVERNTRGDHEQGPAHVLMESIPGAVISTLDLRLRQLTLDSQYLYRNDPTDAIGSGRSNYFFWWPGRAPNLEKQQAINIREGIGYRQAQVGFVADDAILVLPSTAKSYLNYEYMILPFATGRNDHGFDVLRRLEEDYRFDFDFYAFPGERIVRRIIPEYVATSVTVLLDRQARDILVPALPEIMQGKLSYQLEGDGGEYRLSLQEGVSISLGGSATSRWRLDARQLKEAAIRLNGNQLQVGSLRITLHEACGEISLINASAELFSVDREKQALVLLEADGSGFADWRALHAHLRQLTSQAPHSQPFVPVDHYRPAGEDTGRAFYQVSLDRFIYTHFPQISEFLSQALLGGTLDDKAWFYRGADVWQVQIATGQVLRQYRPRTFAAQVSRSSLVQRDGQLLLSIEEALPDGTIQHIYQVEEAALKLLAIQLDGPLAQPGEDSADLLSSAPRWREPTELMTTQDRQVRASYARVVTCTLGRAPATERQWLLFDTEGLSPRVVKANLGAAMAQDLALVGTMAGDKPSFYFYDPHGRQVYFQADDGLSGAPATVLALSDVTSVSGGDQSPCLALTMEGSVWLLDRGAVRLAGVVSSWLLRHRVGLTTALEKLASASAGQLDNLVLWGLRDSAGKALNAWYDIAARQVVQGGSNLDGRHSLTYLGLTTEGGHAWILDADSQQLYRQAQVAVSELSLDEQLVPSPSAADAQVWQTQRNWIRALRQGNSLRLESRDGAIVLLTMAATPADRAVLIALRIKAHQPAGQIAELIRALRQHYELPSAVRLLVEPGQAPGWYLPDSAELLCAAGPQAGHQLTYLGKAAGQAGGYIHDEDSGQLWCIDSRQSTLAGCYSFVHLSEGSLILQLDEADTAALPVLEEANCLMLSGRSGAVHHYPLDRTLLTHYRQIIIDEQSHDAVIRSDSERLVLHRGGQDLMLYDNDAHTSLLIPDIDQAAQRGTKVQLAPQPLSGVLAGLGRQ